MHKKTGTNITNGIGFEVELIRQIENNIDYILMLVKKYHDTHCEDKNVLIDIRKASRRIARTTEQERPD